MSNESNWEHLATLAEQSAYKEVKTANRTPAQKMRDLIDELERENDQKTN